MRPKKRLLGVNFGNTRSSNFCSTAGFISFWCCEMEKIEVFGEGGGTHLSVEGDKLGTRGAAKGVRK